ncbi:hypothetical protein N7497_011325 [Penicillium chrysogenum]|nr:hypothetical protein N7497_011325 [Penicillium chrysogenum]
MTLLSHGYTVVIKAATAEQQHLIQERVGNYRYFGSLQGQQVPVCLGTFTPRVAYWYYGELMALMMILVARESGCSVVHYNSVWRNMLSLTWRT